MSTSLFAEQTLSSQLLEKPAISDLYTISINDGNKWYRVGRSLGMGTDVLEKINVENSAKPSLCKRAMFREWLKVCPKANCTWKHVIEALRDVDQKEAERVLQTISMDTNLKPQKSHTMQFPLQTPVGTTESEKTTNIAGGLTPPPVLGSGHEKPHTEIAGEKISRVSTDGSFKKRQQVLIEGHTTPGKMEGYDDSVGVRRSDVSLESHHESEQGMRGSLSVDVYETASEDDSFMVFNSQHDDYDTSESTTTKGKDQAIVDALQTSNLERIDLLVRQKQLTSSTRLEHKRTPLMFAARRGLKVVVAYFLKVEGLNSLMELDEDGAMALYFAVSEGFYEVAKLLVEQHSQRGVGLDLVVKGTPIIIFPASKGFSMICELLLESGANPNMKDIDGETALHVAASHSHKDVVRVLLRFNADVSVISRKTSMTPLEVAVEVGHMETIKILVEANLQVKQKNLKLFSCQTREEIGQLVKAGANVNVRHGDGTTPLMRHAENGRHDLVLELLHHQANVNLQDESGESALMKASYGGHVKVVETLIEREAILDLKAAKGLTALTYSVLHQHSDIVSRLVLAGANTRVKDENGHSMEELAAYTGNKEIMEIIRRSQNVMKQEEQFVSVLSGYFQKKADEDKSKREEQRKKAQKKELMSKMPKPPHSLEDEESTRKNELKNAYERISVLETRVHDLTLQATLEVPTEEDISFLERNRLEAEFKKLKELKRKAEQYTIEAKQTSQRLSAENAKLREDLNKERHYNQLTRDSIIHDIEKLVDDSVRLEEKAQAKLKVFEQEVASRARHMALSSSLTTVGTFDYTREQIKQLILQHSLRMNLSLLVVGGLPYSGKTTLLSSMLKLKETSDQNVCQLPGLTVMEAAFMRNPYSHSRERSPWLSTITKMDAESLMLAACLAQVCARRNQSLSVLDIDESSDVVEQVFRSSLVDKYFGKVFEHLRDLLARLEREGNLGSLQHTSLAFMNIWDIGVNRAVFETMSLLARRCRNLVLLNVFNLKQDAPELNKRLELQNFSRYHGRYSSRKDNERVMQVQKAIVYYSRFVEVCNHLPSSSVLVGTHKDVFEGDKPCLSEVSSQVKHLVEAKVADVGLADALHPQMLVVDAQSEDDAQKVCKTVEEMILNGDRFEKTVPLTWILLRGVLHTTNSLFLPKSELWSYASECGLQNLEELDSWLELFQSCMSIIYSTDESIRSLHHNVVIQPFKFVQCLDRLYYAEFDDKVQFNLKLKMHLNLMQKGLLTYTFAREIWPNDSDATASKKAGQDVACSFMLKVLKDLRILTKVELNISFSSEEESFLPTEQFYFIPSLRPYYSHHRPSRESESLIVMASSVHQTPSDIYSEFLTFIQQQESTKHLKLVPSKDYDSVQLKLVESDSPEVNIFFKLLDFEDLVEIRIEIPDSIHQPHVLSLKQKLCSIMKTTCIEFFHEISEKTPSMSYKLGIISPSCVNGPEDNLVHVVPFELTEDQALDSLSCYTCGRQMSSLQHSDPRTVWITCAYQGSPLKVVSSKDTLSRYDLVNIADDLFSHSSAKISELAVNLGIPEPELSTLKQFCTAEDYPLLILLEWKKRRTVASRPQLISALLRCGLRALVMKLDSTIIGESPPLPLHQKVPPLSAKELSLVTQSVPHKKWKELGSKLGLSTQDMQDFDKPQSEDSLKAALQKWQAKMKNRGEVLDVLNRALTSTNLNSVAELLKHTCSDIDFKGLK